MVATAGMLVLAACGGNEEESMQHDMHFATVDTVGLRAKVVPTEFQPGLERFKASCAPCHGEAALGTAQGPPLVHIYYEPGHHSDTAFRMAVARGVPQHHWNFGNMPPIDGIGPQDLDALIAYVRWLQREAGIR
jgi:mono/diheme cytochrome c family protein